MVWKFIYYYGGLIGVVLIEYNILFRYGMVWYGVCCSCGMVYGMDVPKTETKTYHI